MYRISGFLTLSPYILTVTNRRKKLLENIVEMVKLLKMSNFTFSHNVFYAICILKSVNSTFHLSSAANLNLGRSQNGALGNWLIA